MSRYARAGGMSASDVMDRHVWMRIARRASAANKANQTGALNHAASKIDK